MVAFPSTRPTVEIAPGACATFEIDIPRPPSQWRRTHLVYSSTGLFRAFSIHRTINRNASSGGEWLASGTGDRTVVDELDPRTLVRGLVLRTTNVIA
jgi:hypothetical protein